MIIPFIKYYFKSETKYGTHSPFVFSLIEEVLEDDRHYYAFDHLDYLRDQLKKNDQVISVTDFGAGSRKLKSNQRKISDIAKTSLTGKRLSEFLFRLTLWSKPRTILELGTSLGLSAAYLAKGYKASRLITLEGCPNIAAAAKHNLEYLELENQVEIRVGEFANTLEESIEALGELDMVFIDGHHAEQPTLDYWEKVKPRLSSGALVIFDDIHWSHGMEAAWEAIKKDEGVYLSVDLFYKGIIQWKKKDLTAEHFTIIEKKWKPWRMGFWK